MDENAKVSMLYFFTEHDGIGKKITEKPEEALKWVRRPGSDNVRLRYLTSRHVVSSSDPVSQILRNPFTGDVIVKTDKESLTLKQKRGKIRVVSGEHFEVDGDKTHRYTLTDLNKLLTENKKVKMIFFEDDMTCKVTTAYIKEVRFPNAVSDEPVVISETDTRYYIV